MELSILLQSQATNTEYLWDLVAASEYLQSERLKAIATSLVVDHPNIDHSYKFQMALHHNVAAWFPEPVTYLVVTAPWSDIVPLSKLIPGEAYGILAEAKRLVTLRRLEIAYNTPFDWSWECECWQSCEEAWRSSWWGEFARNLLMPDEGKALHGEAAIKAIETVNHIEGMCILCLDTCKTFIRKRDPWKQSEIREVEGALEKLGAFVAERIRVMEEATNAAN